MSLAPGMHRAAVLVLMVFLAGCLQAGGPDAEEEAGPVVHPNDGTDCSELIVLVPISFDHAADVLPEGFAAVDLGQTFGLGGDVGQAGAYVFAVDCGRSAWGNASTRLTGVAIGVEEPDITTPAPPASLHFYVFETKTDNPHILGVLGGAGWNVQQAGVSYSRHLTVGLESGEAATDGFSLEVRTRAPSALDGISRSWQVTSDGRMAHIDHALDQATVTAGQATCGLSGMAAEVTGVTECGAGAVGLVILETDWTGEFRLL